MPSRSIITHRIPASEGGGEPGLMRNAESPITTVVALQIFAYYFARERGCEIDQPRNLAKSVTVE